MRYTTVVNKLVEGQLSPQYFEGNQNNALAAVQVGEAANAR